MARALAFYSLSEKALRSIIDECSQTYPFETGGMVIGWFDDDHVYIEYATRPGPLAKHSTHAFRRDGNYSQQVLDEVVIESDGVSDYVGEWHSHPIRSDPSPKDVAAMRWIAENERYLINKPILCICTRCNMEHWRIEVFFYTGRRLQKLRPFDESGA